MTLEIVEDKDQVYRYYIPFAWRDAALAMGYGCSFVDRNGPIESESDIRSVAATIAIEEQLEDVVILDWKRLQ